MIFQRVATAFAVVVVASSMLAADVAAQRRDRDDDRRQERRPDRDRDDGRARERGWELLGEQRVGFRVDRDVIRVGQSEDWHRSRRFRTLHFMAEGNDIHMMSIRLVYQNGFGEDFRVDRLIREGEELPIDLRGERSFISQIEMVYRARPGFGGQAVIKVYGEPSRRGPPGPIVDRDRDRDDGRARGRGWELLGEQRVGFRVDRDAIRIGQSEDWYRSRRFRTLHFMAEGNDIHMMSIRLVYQNGFGEDFRVDRLIREGEELPIDLRGERSFISQIEMVYRARPGFGGQAVIKVYGEPSRRGPPETAALVGGGRGGWTELGCEQVSLVGKDRDTIRVGRDEGRFSAIRLHVRGADVEVLNLRVVYANGDPDDLQVRHFVRAGEHTAPLELSGRGRSIDRVEMQYRSNLNPLDIIANQRLGQATVCVEGLQR